jgi:hypothetical protein
MRKSVIVAGLLAALTTSLGASAQEAGGQANVGMSLPGATPAAAAAGASDHDQVVGRLAVTYFGITNVGAGADGCAGGCVGLPATGSNSTPYAVAGFAPVVGVRYWINNLLGIDAGVGLSVVGGSTRAEAPPAPPDPIESDRDSFTAFLFHAGVPLALTSADHFTFEIIPEANVAFASATQDPLDATGDNPAGDVSHKGFHFDIGARAGAEIHFGFIKIPQLALQASIGLRFDVDNGSTEDTQPAGGDDDLEVSSSRTHLHTTVQGAPWAIFTNNIAALYYF